MKFNKKIKFFCFPYAGGSVNVYNQWKKYLHNSIDLQLVELKGKISEVSYHLLPNDEFISKLKRFGGIPEVLYENSDLFNFFIPIIRNDFYLLSTYEYRERVKKLSCRFDILYGQDEYDITSYEMIKWNNYTFGQCEIRIFPGGHFYLFDNVYNVVKLINSVLV